MRKTMMVKKEIVFKTSMLKCIEMHGLHAIFINSSIVLIILIFFCVDFGNLSD
jgi:hypothetical protein